MEPGQVRELFDYDPETGLLRWRVSRSRWRAGDVVGTPHSKHRYMCIRFEGKEYANHRLAFAWMMGRWPEPMVDHKNQDKLDNRWCNLREATASQNSQNRKVASTNKLGFKGVIAKERYGVVKYEAVIRLDNGRRKHLGRFNTPQEAHQAYVMAAEAHHGEFAKG